MGTVPAWVTAQRSHAMDPHKRVIIAGETLVPTLCGVLLNDDEMRKGNVAFFGTMATAVKRTECEGCRNEARLRDSRGVAHRDYDAVGDAAALPEAS